jgi:hypothetical protein
MEDVTNAVIDLKAVAQTSFEQVSWKWNSKWERCITVQEDCSKGDYIQ